MISKGRDVIAPQFGYDNKRIVQTGLNASGDTWTIDGKMDAAEFELLTDPAITSLQKSDVIEVWYSQVYKQVSMSNNRGTTCFELSLEYDNSISQEVKYDQHQVGDNICVKSDSTEATALPALWEDVNVNRLIVNHRTGKISCGNLRESFFGCDGLGYSLLFLNNEGHWAPDFDKDNQVLSTEELSESQPTLWKINSKTDSFVFDLRMSMATIMVSNKFQAVFAKTFYSGKSGDIKGETCFDVFVEYEKHVKNEPEVIPSTPDVVIDNHDDDDNRRNTKEFCPGN